MRYDLCAIAVCIMLALLCCQGASADALSGNIYGFPMGIAEPYASAACIPGQGFSYFSEGYTLPDFGTTYGMESASTSPILSGSLGYFGTGLDSLGLGVSFGVTNANHDASSTAYAKDLSYQSTLDQTFIGFPGLGVGSLGVGFPTISNQKSSVSYSESVKFEFSTESDTFQIGGFGYPLGLGLGYTTASINTGPGLGILDTPFYFGY